MELDQIRTLFAGRDLEWVVPVDPIFTAVLIPVIEKDGELQILFEVRSGSIAQGGEVCFPGGHLETGEDAREAAVRETCEELLVDPSQVEMIAPMHRLIDRGRLVVDSFLGVLHDYNGIYSEDEVSSIFTVPLSQFLEREPEEYDAALIIKPGNDFPFDLLPGGRDYPFFQHTKKFYFYRMKPVIWGLTAEILYHCIQVLLLTPGGHSGSASSRQMPPPQIIVNML